MFPEVFCRNCCKSVERRGCCLKQSSPWTVSFHILYINSSRFSVGLTVWMGGGVPCHLSCSPVLFMDTTRIPRRSHGLCLVSPGSNLCSPGMMLEFWIHSTMTSDDCGWMLEMQLVLSDHVQYLQFLRAKLKRGEKASCREGQDMLVQMRITAHI